MTRAGARQEALQWFGVFGAPLAWAAQHVAGFALTLARCDAVGSQWPVPLKPLTVAISVVAALVAVLAAAAAVATFRATRGAGHADAPPRGRIHFFAIVGMTVSPLFLAMILLSSSGVLSLPDCRQS